MIFVGGQKVESFKFPGGELQVNVPVLTTENIEFVLVLAILKSSDDILELLLTVDALRRTYGNIKLCLEIPYFPYARQDRVCNAHEALSIKVMADLINSLNCYYVSVLDPHSNVLPALLNNFVEMPQHLPILDLPHIDVIVSPDAGATKKSENIARNFGLGIVYGRKQRSTKTGEIKSTHVEGKVKGLNCLIVDDICDGGRTFIELAKVLKAKGADQLYLYVSHGIFSKGLGELLQYFDHIYCYHTWLTEYSPNDLTVERVYE